MVYTKSEEAIRFALYRTDVHSSVEQKHIIKQTSNTLDSDNTITTVRGLVTFLWQMVVCC